MEQMLAIAGVENVVGLKKSKIYQLIKEGEFPSGLKLGTRTRRWPSSQIQGWINKKIGGEK